METIKQEAENIAQAVIEMKARPILLFALNEEGRFVYTINHYGISEPHLQGLKKAVKEWLDK